MLKKIQRLLTELHDKNISYCHWKSNEHLNAGLNGETDLDLLIDEKKSSEVKRILNNLDYKKCTAVEYLRYPSIEDYIGLDEETGKLIHIHLHHRIIIGKKFVKSYHIPIEKEVLNSSILDEKNEVYIASPNHEIILLVIRRALKQSLTNRIIPKKNIFPENEEKELNWLLQRINLNEVKENSEKIIDKEFSSLLQQYIKTRKGFSRIPSTVRKKFSTPSLIPRGDRFLKHHLNKFKIGINYIRSKHLNHSIPYKRRLKEDGLIIAFLGVDGSGKSTFVKEIEKWVTWKLDAQKIYFGSGDRRSSLLRHPLKLAIKLRNKVKGKKPRKTKKKHKEREKSPLFKFMKSLWDITLALEKKKKMEKVAKAKRRGMIVLCDRFPQTQISGYNDGPLLKKWQNSKNFLKRRISHWEHQIYKLSEKHPPDIVIKLKITPKIAAKRKEDTPLYRIKEKIDAVKKLKFNPKTKIYEVDSSESIEKTSKKIKNIIWSNKNE